MKGLNYKIIEICIIFLGLTFFILAFFDNYGNANFYRMLINPLLCAYFYLKKKESTSLFFKFLVFFAIAEFLCDYQLFVFFGFEETELLINFCYYVGFLFYYMAFTFLLVFMINSMNLKVVIKRFPIHILVFFLFSVYTFYETKLMLGDELILLDAIFENLYNVIFILILPISLLNYLYHDNVKTILLFLCCLFIVFSELSQLVYLHLEEKYIIGLLDTIFIWLGLFFMIMYIKYDAKQIKIST